MGPRSPDHPKVFFSKTDKQSRQEVHTLPPRLLPLRGCIEPNPGPQEYKCPINTIKLTGRYPSVLCMNCRNCLHPCSSNLQNVIHRKKSLLDRAMLCSNPIPVPACQATQPVQPYILQLNV